ncbi:MAG: HupE/UreJ family protein, partial [Pseudomonadota bacterium]
LGLFFLASRLGPLLWQVSAFTLAHTVTLALGALEIIQLPGEIVEPIIAASIVYVGIENVLSRRMQPWRPLVVFAFGLLHGLGFAAVLSDFGLGASHFIPKLIGFNVGVEIGQLAVIAAAWLALGMHFSRYHWYKARLAAPVSIAIAAIAAFWVLERTGMIDTQGIWAPFAAVTEGGTPIVPAVAIGLGIIAIATVIAMSIDEPTVDNICGFVTSFVAFWVLTAAFTAGAYWITFGMSVIWFIALRLQSLGDQRESPADAT